MRTPSFFLRTAPPLPKVFLACAPTEPVLCLSPSSHSDCTWVFQPRLRLCQRSARVPSVLACSWTVPRFCLLSNGLSSDCASVLSNVLIFRHRFKFGFLILENAPLIISGLDKVEAQSKQSTWTESRHSACRKDQAKGFVRRGSKQRNEAPELRKRELFDDVRQCVALTIKRSVLVFCERSELSRPEA